METVNGNEKRILIVANTEHQRPTVHFCPIMLMHLAHIDDLLLRLHLLPTLKLTSMIRFLSHPPSTSLNP